MNIAQVVPSLTQIAHYHRVFNEFQIAAFTLLVVDHLHTLPDEIRLIWKRSFGLMKLLLFIVRYVPLIYGPAALYVTLNLSPNHNCGPIIQAMSVIEIASIICSEAIMYTRVYALSKRNKILGLYLLVQFVAVHVAMSVLAIVHMSKQKYQPSPVPGITACVFDFPHIVLLSIMNGLFIASETVITIISLIYCLPKFKASKEYGLYRTMQRDGIFFYLVLCAMTAASIIFDSTATMELKFLLYIPQGYVHSILSVRLSLHLYKVAELELRPNASTINELSTIEFAHQVTTKSITSGMQLSSPRSQMF